jgi:death on curing protein
VASEPKWLPREAVLAIHDRQLAEHGGSEGIRDAGLLDSALQRPLNKFAHGEPDLFELAAAYPFGIARNHPFVDGNKRVALVASLTFLRLNGFKATSTQEENVAVFLAVAAGELEEEALAAWLRKHARQV